MGTTSPNTPTQTAHAAQAALPKGSTHATVRAGLATPGVKPMMKVEPLARGPSLDGTTRTMSNTLHMLHTTTHAAHRSTRSLATPARGLLAIAAGAILFPLAACSTAPGPREARLQLRANPIEAIEFGPADLALADGSTVASASSLPAPEVRVAHWPWAQGSAQGGAGVFASLPGDTSRPLASRLSSAPETLAAEFTESLRPAP